MHAGGFGAIYEIELLDDRGADVALLGERGRHAPFGVAGGLPAALNRFYFDTDSGRGEPPMASKITGVKIKKGSTGPPRDSRWWRIRRTAHAVGGQRCAPTLPMGS
jgi:N-methylhydantoinase B/oxoprolinase/acetone carboxylase alpha subunit